MIDTSRESLDPDDRETTDYHRSWDDVQERVLDGASLLITLIRPALGHFSTFADLFETKLGPDLDTSLIWGTLACLLKASHSGLGIKALVNLLSSGLMHYTSCRRESE